MLADPVLRQDAAEAAPVPRMGNVVFDVVGGLPIAVMDRSESARMMIAMAMARRAKSLPPLFITSANGQVLSLCASNQEVRSLFSTADLIHADGMPLVLASRWKCRTPLPERVATTDLFHDVAALAQSAGATFYMLGATDATIRAAVANVRRWYPNLQIVGFRNGYFKPEDEDRIVAEINAARPDILWIARGVPSEQQFALAHREHLINVGLVKTAGGLFDFLSGRKRRAPLLMQRIGLEWLFRVAIEPHRLLMRYLVTSPHAIYLLMTRTETGAKVLNTGG